MSEGTLVLPIQVTGRVDVGRLLREVEQIDSFLKQAAIREPGTAVKMPKTSRLLDEFTGTNKLNLLHDDERAKALSFLISVKAKAPMMHMSFSVDPAPAFVEKVTTWLRQEIHPLVLLQVGLQPNIGAGCVVRTTNKYFDFSLREHFKKQKSLLVDKLHGEMQSVAPAEGQPGEQVGAPIEIPAPTAQEQSARPEQAPTRVDAPQAVATEAPSHPQEVPHA